jgi:hypothetical protein
VSTADVYRLATTDDEGRFELRDLPAGRWTVTASKAGFVTQGFGRRRPFDPATPIDLAAGQRATADFPLPRGGAITGRVYDDFGDPVAGARVQALRSRMERGRRRLVPTAAADQTDDTGAFRLYGLAPGEYYVSGSMRNAPAESIVEAGTGAPTYFPGTGVVAEAQRIALGPGEEQSITFPILPVRGNLRVSGIVVNSAGMPVENANVNLRDASNFTIIVGRPMGNFGMTQTDGAFTIVNVGPGAYTITTSAPRDDGVPGPPEQANVPITVTDSDVTGITIVTQKGTIVAGRIVTENGSAAPPLSGVRIRAHSVDGAEFSGGVGVEGSGTFQLPGLLGEWALTLQGLPDEWMVKSIELNGTDVADTVIPFTGAEPNVNLLVVLTNRVTLVNGTVTRRGQAVGDASVVIFPEDPAGWAYPTRRVRSTEANAQGRFSVRALPPDQRYLAVAVEYVDDGEIDDPDFLQRIKAGATPFSLGEGDRTTIDLNLIDR